MKLAVWTYMLLLLCWSSQTLSQDPADPDATTDDMDYEDMNDLFTTPPPPPPLLQSGFGSGSGLVMEESTDPPPDLLPNCMLPEAGSIMPQGLDSLSFATIRGRCHSTCLRRQGFGSPDIQTFSGYPFWTLGYSSFLYSEDGRNGADCLSRNRCNPPVSCSEVNKLLSCKYGCEANLASGDAGCRRRCMNNCERDVCVGPHGTLGCSTNRFPATSCNALCGTEFLSSTGNCELGCKENEREGEVELRNLNFSTTQGLTSNGQALHPLRPPIISSLGRTIFRVDVVDTMPEFMPQSIFPAEFIQLAVGFVTVVLRVTGQNERRFYVLEDSNEVDLGDFFACQTVNVSFAIATNRHGQLSNFSPEVTVKVFNIDTSGPGQILNANVSIDPDMRVRFIRQHIYTITWDQPENIDRATNISLSLTSGRPNVCGDLEPVVLNANATSYVVQAPQPTLFGGAVFPPVTQCSYSLEIAVNPVDPFGDDMPFQTPVHTGPYPLPINSDLIMTCTAVPLGDIYNVTIAFEFSANFTPAVIEGITGIAITRRLATREGGLLIRDGSVAPLAPIVSIFNQTSISNTVTPLREDIYYYTAKVGYRSTIPNFGALESSQNAQAECFVRNVGFLPIPIDTARVSVDSFFVEALTNTRFEVTAAYSFQFEQPNNEILMNFELWFTTSRAPENTTLLTRRLDNIGVLQRNGTIKQTINLEEEIGNKTDFEVFFQLRARSENLVSAWTNPVTFNVSLGDSRPGDIRDEQFNVTSFTYGTSINDMGELVARVIVEVDYRLTAETQVLRLEFCTSEQPLPTVKQFDVQCSQESRFDDVVDMVERGMVVSEKFSSSVAVPSLDTNVYIQVRAVNRASLSGNWSVPEVLHIPDIPSPLSIVATQVGVVQEIPAAESNRSAENLPMMDEDIVTFRIRIGMTWEVPETVVGRRRRQAAVQNSNMPISRYTIAVGMEEIMEPFGTVPEDSFQQDVSESSITQIDVSPEFTVDVSNATDNITLYVQMRSATAEGAFGSWSEPFSLSIDLTSATTLIILPTASAGNTDNDLDLVLGLSIPFAIIAAVILALIVFLVIYIAYRQFKLRRSLKSDGVEGKAFNLWTDNYPELPYIPPGMIEGKEVVVDEWEVPTTDVIVEDHLGEGAFGLVFKGIIRGPLRNPKLSSKMKKSIGLPVAIKLLKDTASNKERKDFWMEIDMMKRISEGYCNNIVNMVGCVTLQEPLCLITEFVPHGDLLDYLRNQRKKQSSRRREEKYLRIQLEQQKRAYEEMKKQMAKLQSAQSDAPGEGRIVAGNSGYADFPETSPKPTSPNRDPASPDRKPQLEESNSSDDSPTADKPLIRPAGETQVAYADFTGNDGVVSPLTIESSLDEDVASHKGPRKLSEDPAPYLEPKNEYSHLDPVVTPPPPQEESDEEVEDELGDIDANDLMQFAYQIATGMEYLASINIVHRDLACRNILVGEGKNLKITDFGLSREVEDVYVKTTKGRLPLKWMALESIDAREFTTFSDVWSYGVVLWEIGTLGGFPYPTIENKDLLMMLKQGYRLEKPDNCAPEVYDIMLECWMEHPQDRPTFSQLRNKFSSLLLATTNDPYMVLEVDEEKTYYTMGAEEEEQFNKDRRESVSSVDSETGIKKEKKKVEKPKWATQSSNPYVQTPSTFKENHTMVEDEHYRPAVVEVEKEESPARNVLDSSDDDDNVASGSFLQKSNGHPSLSESVSTPAASHLPMLSESVTNGGHSLLSPETPVLLEDQVGIPLSFISGEKPSSQRGRPVKRNVSNPYVDDPRTKQLLQEGAEEGKVGSLMQELNQHMAGHDDVTAL